MSARPTTTPPAGSGAATTSSCAVEPASVPRSPSRSRRCTSPDLPPAEGLDLPGYSPVLPRRTTRTESWWTFVEHALRWWAKATYTAVVEPGGETPHPPTLLPRPSPAG